MELVTILCTILMVVELSVMGCGFAGFGIALSGGYGWGAGESLLCSIGA